ncbi:hypothetical protein HW130_27740 [Streptomyces sp. PKU-EA00015]|uniref:hypothetical protein n=1 Tax=Streptomyces sp. PKU-EA00015 TaxID=2748326 RepID=UPI0015A0E4B6|nr:hypothetical protein [Streptomyces sp. PKU-EA00015]NWF30010.1 hypothetical protein [Streptomyces sp. PKU-EA00015]
MRRIARLMTGSALVIASTGLGSAASFAGDSGSLEIHPSTAEPGDTVTVGTEACGGNGRGTGDARALGAGEFTLSRGTHKELAAGRFTVPDDARPGTHGIGVLCKNGKKARGDVTIRHGGPSGHVRTGVGGSVGPDTTQIAAGTAVIAAAAVGGTLLLRRRASGAQDS